MQTIQTRGRVGPDGVLHLAVPVGPGEADREVIVTVQPVAPMMTAEEWSQFVARTAGSIDDPLFGRHEQGQFEARDEFG